MLQYRLLGDKNEWTSAVMTWRSLHGELASRKTAEITPHTEVGEMRKGKEGTGESRGQMEEEEKFHVQNRNRRGEQKDEECENRRLRSGKKNGVQTLQNKRKIENERTRVIERKWEEGTSGKTCLEQTLEKKRKRDDEDGEMRAAAPDSSNEKNVETEKTSERRRREEKQMDMSMEFGGVISGTGSVCDYVVPGVGSGSRSTDDCVVQKLENSKKIFVPDFIYTNISD